MVAAAAESTERRFLRAPASVGGVKVGRTGGYGKRPAARTGCRPFWPGGWLRGAVARLRSRGASGALVALRLGHLVGGVVRRGVHVDGEGAVRVDTERDAVALAHAAVDDGARDRVDHFALD